MLKFSKRSLLHSLPRKSFPAILSLLCVGYYSRIFRLKSPPKRNHLCEHGNRPILNSNFTKLKARKSSVHLCLQRKLKQHHNFSIFTCFTLSCYSFCEADQPDVTPGRTQNPVLTIFMTPKFGVVWDNKL